MLKKIETLKTKKGRDATGWFIVESEKLIREIPADWNVRCYVCTETFAAAHDLTVYKARAVCLVIRDNLFAKLSDTVTPQGVLAVCEQRAYAVDQLIKARCLLLMGECLSDPGNIGTLIRTADAAGADGVMLSKNSGELYNPKVLRAAAGSVLHIPVVTGVALPEAIAQLQKSGVAVYAAHPRGQTLPYALDMNRSCCILVGNEAHGLSDTVCDRADAWVTLPMPGRAESLNASVAGGLLLYEAVRQRIQADGV